MATTLDDPAAAARARLEQTRQGLAQSRQRQEQQLLSGDPRSMPSHIASAAGKRLGLAQDSASGQTESRTPIQQRQGASYLQGVQQHSPQVADNFGQSSSVYHSGTRAQNPWETYQQNPNLPSSGPSQFWSQTIPQNAAQIEAEIARRAREATTQQERDQWAAFFDDEIAARVYGGQSPEAINQARKALMSGVYFNLNPDQGGQRTVDNTPNGGGLRQYTVPGTDLSRPVDAQGNSTRDTMGIVDVGLMPMPQITEGGGAGTDQGGQVPGQGGQAGQQVPGQSGFDFNPEYEASMNRLRAQEAEINSSYELTNRRQNEDSQLAISEMNRVYQESLKANTENMADRGMVYSGINIDQQAEIGRQFTQTTDMIQRALSRGEEDLARHLAQQFTQLQNSQREAEVARAESQAVIDAERAMNEAINATPQPTVAGRYPLEGVNISNQAIQGSGSDRASFSDPLQLANAIEKIFNDAGIPIHSSNETDFERILRITQDVAEGKRDLDNVRESVDRIARQMGIA